MRFPDVVGLRCLAGHQPFPATWVTLTLENLEDGMRKAFSFAFGPGREDGRVFVRRDEVLAQGRYLEEAVGLDYARIEDRWQGRCWISVAGAAELRHQFRLSFAQPPLRQASARRVAAARALRFLYENEDEPLSVAVETELPKKVVLHPVPPANGNWLPEHMHEPVRNLLSALARRDLNGLIATGALAPDRAGRIEQEIIDYGASPVIPPDIALLLANATSDDGETWTIEVPLWTREEGPSDLLLWIRARDREDGPELELRGTAPA
jgi:hypothetical protein